MNEFYLTIIGFDIEGGEESIIVGVVDEFRIPDNNSFVGVFVEFFEAFDAKFEVEYKCGRNFNFFVAVGKAGSLIVWENSDDFDENVDKFKDFRFVYFLIDFILSDVEGNIEESD